LYKDDNQLDVSLKGRVFAVDATVIDLCLSVFCWANFRSTKAAVKLHTVLDLKTSIPEFILITEGNVHDVNALDVIEIEKGSYYIMDGVITSWTRGTLILRGFTACIKKGLSLWFGPKKTLVHIQSLKNL
jgi:hypothetical protein